MSKDEKHSGQVWCTKLNIVIINPKGWNNINDFNHILITKEEFLNRAISSDIKPISNSTRRNAKKMLNKL